MEAEVTYRGALDMQDHVRRIRKRSEMSHCAIHSPDGNGIVCEECQRLERELDQMTKERDEARGKCDELSNRIAELQSAGLGASGLLICKDAELAERDKKIEELKSHLSVAKMVLKDIANMDYRGNRSHEMKMAKDYFAAIKEKI